MTGTNIWTVLTKPHDSRSWDIFLRATLVVSLLSIPVTWLFPNAIPLVCFGLLTVPANSVLAPLVPVSFELLIIETSKYASVISIALVGVGVFCYMEYLNWHIYRWLLSTRRLESICKHPWVTYVVKIFQRSPFLVVTVFSFTPLPFWVVRMTAVLNRYSLRRYMLATALGRGPRIALYAWLGSMLQVPSLIVLVALAGAMLLVVVISLRSDADASSQFSGPMTDPKEELVCQQPKRSQRLGPQESV
ncbi:MAG: hypothetical protein KJT03_01540 [Verrucomicrobiae bacterium]|nr:hypothetical protein [Verrucomicrobiae bacterium]